MAHDLWLIRRWRLSTDSETHQMLGLKNLLPVRPSMHIGLDRKRLCIRQTSHSPPVVPVGEETVEYIGLSLPEVLFNLDQSTPPRCVSPDTRPVPSRLVPVPLRGIPGCERQRTQGSATAVHGHAAQPRAHGASAPTSQRSGPRQLPPHVRADAPGVRRCHVRLPYPSVHYANERQQLRAYKTCVPLTPARHPRVDRRSRRRNRPPPVLGRRETAPGVSRTPPRADRELAVVSPPTGAIAALKTRAWTKLAGGRLERCRC